MVGGEEEGAKETTTRTTTRTTTTTEGMGPAIRAPRAPWQTYMDGWMDGWALNDMACMGGWWWREPVEVAGVAVVGPVVGTRSGIYCLECTN